MSERAYPARPPVGVGVVLFRGDTVLLVRRGRPPLEGAWSFPGGGQELGETVDAAGRREGVGGGRGGGAIHRAGAGRVLFHYPSLDRAGGDDGNAAPVAGGDAAEARFVALDALEALGLDAAHREVVSKAKALRSIREAADRGRAASPG